MSSTTIKKANGAAAQVNANVTTAQIFAQALNPAAAFIVTAPGGAILEQKPFRVRGSGYITTGTTTNATVTLYNGTSLTAGSNSSIAASTARAVNTTTTPFFFEAELIFDSVSGKLHGTFRDVINNLYDAAAAITGVQTGISGGLGSAEPALNFVLGVTFSAANAANLANLNELVLDF